MIQLSQHFAHKDAGHLNDAQHQQRWFIKAREDNQRREKAADKLDDDLAALASEVILATQAQIAAFETKLDKYDEATVQALMENQEKLDAINARIEAMLDQAHVMEDGRRVFRTEDGQQVFDEGGVEVSSNELDPDTINPSAPTWEAFSEVKAEQARLEAERDEIHEYQEKLDAAREQIADGEISEADLEALDAELIDAMPTAVQAQSPDINVAEPKVAENAPQLGPRVEQVTQAVRFTVAPSPMP